MGGLSIVRESKRKGKVLGWREGWHRREPGTGEVLKKCSSLIPSYHTRWKGFAIHGRW